MLRHQLNVLRRKSPQRVVFFGFDRLVFAGLYALVPNVLDALQIVKLDTVIRWHCAGFRAYWRWKSRFQGGRPGIPAEIRKLIREMSATNPLWGAPRIHGELLKLGIDIGQTTVAKYMVKEKWPPGQGWRTFLHNHADGIASMDFFAVPTVSFRLLYGLLILQHSRRELLWLGVTAHPTAEWLAQQVTEAFGWRDVPRYLVRDRDRIYGTRFVQRVRAMGIRDRPTSARSPWQNGYAERLIGSIRCECLDHVVVFGERHLRNLLLCYQSYYNESRTHLSLGKDAPLTRAVQVHGRIAARPVLGGLHHHYCRICVFDRDRVLPASMERVRPSSPVPTTAIGRWSTSSPRRSPTGLTPEVDTAARSRHVSGRTAVGFARESVQLCRAARRSDGDHPPVRLGAERRVAYNDPHFTCVAVLLPGCSGCWWQRETPQRIIACSKCDSTSSRANDNFHSSKFGWATGAGHCLENGNRADKVLSVKSLRFDAGRYARECGRGR